MRQCLIFCAITNIQRGDIMNMRLLRRTFFVLLLILLPVSVALAQNHNEPFLYLDIPFENISEDQTAELLLKQQGILLEESMVTDYYGYPMELFVNFAPGQKCISYLCRYQKTKNIWMPMISCFFWKLSKESLISLRTCA